MDSIISFSNPFSPRVTADKVIGQIAAGGLANEVEQEPTSCSEQIVFGVMSALTGVFILPLFMKLYEFIQQSYYIPEERKLLAVLGCKVATAPIIYNHEKNERSIKIELGGENELDTTLFFIQRMKTDGSEKTEIYVKDYTGERLYQEYSTLKEVQAFYKVDLAENKDGIYRQNVSPELFVASTLGVAVCNYCSGNIDQHDLSNLEKFSRPEPNSLLLSEGENSEAENSFLLGNNITLAAIIDVLLKVKKSDWEVVRKQLASLLKNPVISTNSELTVQDFQLRIEKLIRTRAEEEARCYVNSSVRAWNYQSDNNGSSDLQFALRRNIILEKRLIKMAGVYALAQAFLTPEEAASNDHDIYLQRHIVNNTESLNAIKRYFNFPRICNKRKNAYYDECREIAKRLRQFNAPDEPTNDLLNRTIEDAIDTCFWAVKNVGSSIKNYKGG